jgi:MerR family transcriptional regulator, copper efflux regulator
MQLSIGELAKKAEIGVETVRFYERRGLLAEPDRRASGYRMYDVEVVDILRFIRRAKELGFTLKEIQSLLEFRRSSSATRADVRRNAQSKLIEIDAKIRDLQRMRDALFELVKSCHGNGVAAGCPILVALNGDPKRIVEADTTKGEESR